MPIPLPAGLTNRAKKVSGDQIAADALKYRGHPYTFGGWDCSSFVNHVLGQDLGLTLPGGLRGYRGPPPHGPVVVDYANWGGASPTTTPARGDLAVWPGIGANGHIGIVLGPDQMISALDPAMGTAVTAIHGFGPSGVAVVYRRVNGVTAGAPAPGSPGAASGAGGQPSLAAPAFAILLVAGMAAAVVGGAVLLAIGAVTLGTMAMTRLGGSDA